MEITGIIEQVLPVQTGVSKSSNKEWREGGFILNTEGQYPKKVCINIFGKKLDEICPVVGQRVTVHVEIDSREWKGKWFTKVSAWKMEQSGQSPVSVPPAQPQPTPSTTPTLDAMGVTGHPAADFGTAQSPGDDDLPF